eukprot:gene706-12009_t
MSRNNLSISRHLDSDLIHSRNLWRKVIEASKFVGKSAKFWKRSKPEHKS